MEFIFPSYFTFGESLPAVFDELDVKIEPMLFGCDWEAAWDLGGHLTHSFLDRIKDWKTPDTIIDSRVHMLMPGWFPCIPGWHHDDVPRERSDGQPNYINPSYRAEHCMAIVGDASITEFAIGTAIFQDVPLGEVYYKTWHPVVEKWIELRTLSRVKVPVSRIIYFDNKAWHQGVRATKNGWRWFIRATRNSGRKHANELRRQVQVYLEFPMEGW